MTRAILSTTYFGPVQWYQKLNRYDLVFMEQHESFQKQTFRNRCMIATTQGVQSLSFPIEHDAKDDISNIRLSDHGNWRHVHWQAIASAYGDSPFFEFYEDDIRPFFFERKWERLMDYNEAICKTLCQLLDIHPKITKTEDYSAAFDGPDFRDAIRPKHPLPDADFLAKPYYQVFREKHGFLPNLSILDLLFNMGPESIFYL